MRRTDREIKEFDQLLDVMRRCDVCRLALNDEEVPYILPLNFGMEVRDGTVVLYFHGAMEGTKYDRMARDNRAAFEMDCAHRLVVEQKNDVCSCTMEYESVIGRGVVEMVEDEEEKFHGLTVLMGQYHKEDCPFSRQVMARTRVFKLTVSQMTGKRRMKR